MRTQLLIDHLVIGIEYSNVETYNEILRCHMCNSKVALILSLLLSYLLVCTCVYHQLFVAKFSYGVFAQVINMVAHSS